MLRVLRSLIQGHVLENERETGNAKRREFMKAAEASQSMYATQTVRAVAEAAACAKQRPRRK